MKKKLFTRIHEQKKKQVNISIDSDLKDKLIAQKAKDGVSISERIENFYRSHREAIEAITLSKDAFVRSRGERGKPMYSDRLRSRCEISLTPKAIAFFDSEAQKKGIDRSKIIELAIRKLL